MKRSEVLIGLSRDHHQALVFARRIAQCPEGTQEATALQEKILAQLVPALSEHFAEEERGILVQARGKHAAEVRRTLAEHEHLKSLTQALQNAGANALKPFGALLAEHVRFEERTLFPLIEQMLQNQDL
ncbi:MAG: hemerythrin domain-containing protein [Betaproteobacteria bacterium]|nr:hemerythrin domain-containing protein [Betaproteobacteria bacterium]